MRKISKLKFIKGYLKDNSLWNNKYYFGEDLRRDMLWLVNQIKLKPQKRKRKSV